MNFLVNSEYTLEFTKQKCLNMYKKNLITFEITEKNLFSVSTSYYKFNSKNNSKKIFFLNLYNKNKINKNYLTKFINIISKKGLTLKYSIIVSKILNNFYYLINNYLKFNNINSDNNLEYWYDFLNQRFKNIVYKSGNFLDFFIPHYFFSTNLSVLEPKYSVLIEKKKKKKKTKEYIFKIKKIDKNKRSNIILKWIYLDSFDVNQKKLINRLHIVLFDSIFLNEFSNIKFFKTQLYSFIFKSIKKNVKTITKEELEVNIFNINNNDQTKLISTSTENNIE